MYPEDEDDRELTDIPTAEPVGSAQVTFGIPVPTIEQVTGQIARQLISEHIGYDRKRIVQDAIDNALSAAVDDAIDRKVKPLIDELLERPMRPTDAFGNPVGEPTTLQAFVTQRVQGWADDVVDSDGKPGKPDRYHSDRYAPRINWLVAQVVNRELKGAIDSKVSEVIAEIKSRGEKQIASQVAEKIASLIIRNP